MKITKTEPGSIPNPFEILSRIEHNQRRLECEVIPKLIEAINTKTAAAISKDRLMSRKEVSEALGCSASTVDNLRRSNRIERIKVGRSVRFRSSDIQRLMTTQK